MSNSSRPVQSEPAAVPSIRSIPLQALHQAHGAKFGPFAGFNMPIQYGSGLKAEHLHTRQQAGLFDVSHMGQLRVIARNGDASTLRKALEAALPVDFDGWPSGQQRYSLLLNDQGGIEDDLMLVWRPGPLSEVRMVVNAGNRQADLQRLQSLAPELQFEWVDAALLALQGPQAEAVLCQFDPRASAPKFMESIELNLDRASCLATRSGYTGEDGYEISVPSPAVDRVARKLLADSRVALVGLGARDTLRLEAGLPLHGQDISPSVTPVEAGLLFGIAPSRRPGGAKAGGYPGAQVIEQQMVNGPARRLVAFTSQAPIPIRAHSSVVLEDDSIVGEVTSGTVSPSLGFPILVASVQVSALNQPLFAQVRQKKIPLSSVKLPFVPKRYKR
jgi:aminomethyltransferase